MKWGFFAVTKDSAIAWRAFVRPNAPAGNERGVAGSDAPPQHALSPFRCFNSSPEVIRLVVLMYEVAGSGRSFRKTA
jgi:hypothetical protein